MTVLAKKPATYADIEAAAPHVIAEIIDGQVVTRRFFGPRDGMALTRLHHTLAGPGLREMRPAAAWVMLRPEVHVGDHVLVPELGMWRRSDVWDFEDWRDFKVRPQWVLEWVTHSTNLDQHVARCRYYAEAGIPALWRVDSVASTLQTFTLAADSQWQLQKSFGADARVAADPFPNVEIDLAALWELPWPAVTSPSEPAT
ncbi:MAG: Uma2 family endonuclease [Hyphomicrobiaceae bacterium]